MCESCDEWVNQYRLSGKAGRWNPKTAKRRRSVETVGFLAMVARLIRRAGVRVADADEIELGMLIGLQEELRDSIQMAVDGMRDRGMTWQYIGTATGVKRSAAQEGWGRESAA